MVLSEIMKFNNLCEIIEDWLEVNDNIDIEFKTNANYIFIEVNHLFNDNKDTITNDLFELLIENFESDKVSINNNQIQVIL